MVAPLLLTSGPARCETTLHGCWTSKGCLFYAIATVFQLYHGDDMMYEMGRRKRLSPSHSVGWAYTFTNSKDLPTPYRHGMRGTDKCYGSDWVSYVCTQGHLLSDLTNWAISPPQVIGDHQETTQKVTSGVRAAQASQWPPRGTAPPSPYHHHRKLIQF